MFLILPVWVVDALAFITQLWVIIIEALTNFEAMILASFFLQMLIGIALLFVGFKVIRKIVGLIKSFGS